MTNPTRSCHWGTVVDQLLAGESVDEAAADDVSWTLTDQLGSVRDWAVYNPALDATSIARHVTYDAFGNLTSDSAPAVESLFLFTARPYDADAQLQNNLNRWYDPATGRWMSTDPIGFEAGDANLYRYVGNGSTWQADPSGLEKDRIVVEIYRTPTGTFDFKLESLTVNEPDDQKLLGPTTIGFTIFYNAPKGVCSRPTEQITLTLAIDAPGFLTGYDAEFDYHHDPSNRNLAYPVYLGQRPGGSNTLSDAPFNGRSTDPVEHAIAVCAICNTRLCDDTGRLLYGLQQRIGCISFKFRDRDARRLLFGGAAFGAGDEKRGIPADDPDSVWREAKEAWDEKRGAKAVGCRSSDRFTGGAEVMTRRWVDATRSIGATLAILVAVWFSMTYSHFAALRIRLDLEEPRLPRVCVMLSDYSEIGLLMPVAVIAIGSVASYRRQQIIVTAICQTAWVLAIAIICLVIIAWRIASIPVC